MSFKPGDKLIVLTDNYRALGRTKGSLVTVIEDRGAYVDVQTEVTTWLYRKNEVRKLTKLERALK